MKTKVLHVVDKYGYGGVETVVDALVRNFVDASIEPHYLYLRNTKVKKVSQGMNEHVHEYGKFSALPVFAIAKFIFCQNIKIVHTHHRKGFYIAQLLSLFYSSVKFIHHEHGDILVENNFYTTFFRFFSKRIDLVICVSTHNRDELIRKTGIDRNKLLVTIYHTDDEAANFWKKIAGLNDDKIIKCL